MSEFLLALVGLGALGDALGGCMKHWISQGRLGAGALDLLTAAVFLKEKGE